MDLVIVRNEPFIEIAPVRTTAKLSPSRVVLIYNAERLRWTCSNAAITAGCCSVSGSDSILSAKSGTHAHAAKETRHGANAKVILIVRLFFTKLNHRGECRICARMSGFRDICTLRYRSMLCTGRYRCNGPRVAYAPRRHQGCDKPMMCLCSCSQRHLPIGADVYAYGCR